MKIGKSKEKQPADQSVIPGRAEYIIPVMEEEVVIDKKIVSRGGITVTKQVITEEISVDTPVQTEHIDVERIPVNQYVQDHPEIRHEGETMIIPVLKEVIEKRLLLVEEIRITRRQTTETRQEKITLSGEKVTITEKSPEEGSEK